MLPKHINSVIPCCIFTAHKQMKLVDMADIQARHVRQHGHGGGHVKGNNNESVSLNFSLPVASVCVPVVSSSGAEEHSLKEKPDFFVIIIFHHLNVYVFTYMHLHLYVNSCIHILWHKRNCSLCKCKC